MKKLIRLTILLLAIGCSESDADKYHPKNTIHIDVENSLSSSTDFINLIDSFEIIPLKSDYIGSVSNIISDSGYYYALDKTQSRIYKFDSLGNEVLSINRKGRSREEYLSIEDIIIVGDKLRVFDDLSSKIIDYSKKDGTYIGHKKIKFGFSSALSNKNFTVVYNSTGINYFSPNMIAVFDDAGKKKNEYIKIPSFLKNIDVSQYFPLSNYRDEVLFTRLLSRHIYAITQDSIHLKYRLDFGKKNITDDYLENISAKNAGTLITTMIKSNYVNSIDFVFETDSHLYFIFLYKGKMHTAYYNKITYKTIVLNLDQKDTNRIWAMSQHVSTDEDGRFISLLYTTIISDEMRNDLIKQDNEITDKLVKCLDNYKSNYEYFVLSFKFK